MSTGLGLWLFFSFSYKGLALVIEVVAHAAFITFTVVTAAAVCAALVWYTQVQAAIISRRAFTF
jgi:hypothetical protein